MTMSFGLNKTLGAAIAVIALVSIAATLIILSALNTLTAEEHLRNDAQRARGLVSAFNIDMLNQETSIRAYMITANTVNLDPYNKSAPHLEIVIARLREVFGRDPAVSPDLEAAIAAARQWQTDVANSVLADMRETASRDAVLQIEKSGEGKRLFDALRDRFAVIDAELTQRIKRHAEAFRAASDVTWETICASGVFIVLLSLGIGVTVNRAIAKPLVNLTGVMRRLAGKDLKADVPSTERRDEIGDMARAVAVFKQGLIEVERTSLLRAIADTVPSMIIYIDKARHVRFLNSGFETWFDLRGATVADLTDHPVETLFPDKSLPGYPDQLSSALQNYPSRVDHQLISHANPEAGLRDVEVIYQPHLSPEGELLGAVSTITDITQRKDLDRRLLVQARDLKRSNEELEQFAYVASHDLKAPLRGIENLVTWIEEDIADVLTPDTRTNMSLLRNRVQRLDNLLNDLLEYSRAGRRSEAVERIDTRGLVADLAALISPPEGFSIVVSDSLPTMLAPRAPLTQLFQNLMSNAIKHHDKAAMGHLWVEGGPAGGMMEFVVADDGPGIPKRYHERVFGMFQTLRPRDEVEGSGMGLAIVKKLIEANGGAVSLHDRTGGGLEVRFTWPLTNPAAARPADPAARRDDRPAQKTEQTQ